MDCKCGLTLDNGTSSFHLNSILRRYLPQQRREFGLPVKSMWLRLLPVHPRNPRREAALLGAVWTASASSARSLQRGRPEQGGLVPTPTFSCEFWYSKGSEDEKPLWSRLCWAQGPSAGLSSLRTCRTACTGLQLQCGRAGILGYAGPALVFVLCSFWAPAYRLLAPWRTETWPFRLIVGTQQGGVQRSACTSTRQAKGGGALVAKSLSHGNRPEAQRFRCCT